MVGSSGLLGASGAEDGKITKGLLSTSSSGDGKITEGLLLVAQGMGRLLKVCY